MADPELWTAVLDNDLKAVTELIEVGGVDVQEKGGDRQSTALQLAVSLSRDPAIVQELLLHTAWRKIDEIFEGQTLLHNVICPLPNMPLAEMLLRFGANTEIKDNRGETPLNLSAGIGADEFAMVLLENGANVNARQTHDGFTPLMSAAFEGREDLVKTLLMYRADMSLRDYKCDLRADEWAKRRGFHYINKFIREKRLGMSDELRM